VSFWDSSEEASLARRDNWPPAHTKAFQTFVHNWSVVIVWDKDHTMVSPDNVLRPNLAKAMLDMWQRHPTWVHIILTENSYASVLEMFDMEPSIEPIFRMVLCRDNYFSKFAIRKYFRHLGHWWLWGKKVRREKTRRRERRVNDLFIGKKVVLIDDLQAGRVPNHSCCVPSKVWEGTASSPGELEWPNRLEENILAVLKRLYAYHPVPVEN
jgi:hypothetical protein